MKHRFLLLFLLLATSSLAEAQSEHSAARQRRDSIRAARLHRADSLLDARYRRLTYDTLYLARPAYDFTAKARLNVSGNSIGSSGTLSDREYKNRIESDHNLTTSIGLSFRGIGLALSLNPAKLSGHNHNSEFNISIYNNRWGVDAAYQDARDYHGNITVDGLDQALPSDVVTTRIVSLNAYYAFNHRRFSFPAAFTQSYIQRRSAGSWMLALSAIGGGVNTQPIADLYEHDYSLRMIDIGLGGGYGYNWVPWRRFMLHASFLPTVVVAAFNRFAVDGEYERVPFSFPEFILTERVAATYYFNDRHFASLTFVMTNSIFASRREFTMHYDRWRLRVCYGFRFSLGKKKK